MQSATSSKGNIWVFPEPVTVPDEVRELVNGNEVIASLLVSRGYDTAEKANVFLHEENYKPTSPMELPDVDKAVRRITEAIHNQEHITIYGDYDVDGVTGTSVLLSVLKDLGADVDFYIPNRIAEGYGLNLKAVSILASKHKTKLIITCDCGVSNFSEINFAKSLGVDTLVLDHHTMPEMMPPAVGIVHPKLLEEDHPLFDLPGVGVAYKVCEALLQDNNKAEQADELIDLVTMGMIADLVPLVRENRFIVRSGLKKLLETKRVGLKALLGQVKKQNNTDLVGFGIAPRINAAGRLSDATKAVELLTTDDVDRANEIADQLQKENTRRQELCETIFHEADRRLQADKELPNKKCIAIYDANWHHGVVGIVASRLVEKYHRPVFIGQLDQEEGIVKGSARGVSQLDLYEVLKENEHLLSKWGGHKMAAGFSVKANKADQLMQGLVNTCNKMLANKPIAGTVVIDYQANPELIDLGLARELVCLAPFGMGNRKPRLSMLNLTCTSVRALGKEKKHSRIMLAKEGHQTDDFECVMWNTLGRVPSPGQKIDIAFVAEVNHFNNRDRLQLVLEDWRSADATEKSTGDLQNKEVDAPSTVTQVAGVGETVSSVDSVGAGSSGSSEQIASIVEKIAIPTKRNFVSSKTVWKDLRKHEAPLDILSRANKKLGEQLIVFSETRKEHPGVKFCDRTELSAKEHLIIWQFPPSLAQFQKLIETVEPKNIYLIGSSSQNFSEPVSFLKRLYGLSKYAVNQKDGMINGEKMTALMASDKVSVALGLTVLRKANLLDWFAEDGIINLDLLSDTPGKFSDCQEFDQLVKTLAEITNFRQWCSESIIKDIQLAIVQNGVRLPTVSTAVEESLASDSESVEHGNANGKDRAPGIETSS